jgi:endonuclease/exonuclease/phosphatase family metal-dependent hydrolase
VTGTTEKSLNRALLGALVLVLGAEAMRFLFASITWYLRDTLLIGTLDLIPIALAPFLAGAVLPVLSRWIGVRAALWSAVWMLALARILLQVSSSPAFDFWMAAAGTMAFVGCLPLLLSVGRETITYGFVLGLTIDSAIKGLSLSLDLAYQPGLLPILAVVVIGIAAIYLSTIAGPFERAGPGPARSAQLLGIAPFLFCQFLVLQNQGWTAEVTGMSSAAAAVRIAVLNVVALAAVSLLPRARWLAWVSAPIVGAAVMLAEGPDLAFNLLSILAIPAAAITWFAIVPRADGRGLGASASYLTAGMTLFVIAGLAYYLPLDLSVPFELSQVRIAFALLLVIFGLAGAAGRPGPGPLVPRAWVLGAGAALLPLFALVVVSLSDPTPADGSTRFMSYNVHEAYNVDGAMDVEAIAQVIEDTGATVVGLQEVPRGRLLSGNTDLLYLLQNRLGFEYVAFFGTVDPTWGNAILSRYPIGFAETYELPRVGTPMQRGYLGANIIVEPELSVWFISTHLQHVNDPDAHDEDPEADLYPVHHEQIAEILAAWGGTAPAIMVGDFNARPDWQQIAELLDAGWVDSWAEAGSGDGFTSPSNDPRYRIDYIFHTPDLAVSDIGVIQSTASDHFPVVADIPLD